MRIATWNVNSVTARLPRLLDWLATAEPDVLCLQELKVTPAAFPTAEVAALGYQAAVHADGRWNGVAVLSRVGLADVVRGLDDEPGFPDPECRAVAATCGPVRVRSVYVPNGREPGHEHYAYKLAWLEALRATTVRELGAEPARPHAVLGDFNVAPTDADVWDPALFTASTHVTTPERDAIGALVATGLTDLPPRIAKGPPYTYWDYRQGAFHKGMGMRIDLVLANAVLAAAAADTWIDRDARKGTGPSDHAPVVLDADVSSTD